ncbi:monoglyceride lipase-like isoform X1 [Liolophura sinensis]|uniref:monoglyceride lipase-like isoform X1 n=1 Tax=Liolophura sinensis TaxID=3198878 RepID=UPI003158670B
MAIAKESGYFTNSDDTKIFTHVWKIEGDWKPKALVFIAHGVAEHCLWYTKVAEILVNIGCLVFSHDHVGHGQSEGDRVHIETFSTYISDVFQHCDKKRDEYPGLPLFMIGHSMGGAIAVMCGLERAKYFEGIVLIAAAIVASPEALSPFRQYMGKWVARICPQFPVMCLDNSGVSRDAAAVERYKNDPLVWHGGLKAKWGLCMLDAMNRIQENFEQIEWPVLILHGDTDKIVDVSGATLMNEKIRSKDKTLKVYTGFYHQLHSEPGEDGERVRQDIKEWIEQRMSPVVQSEIN